MFLGAYMNCTFFYRTKRLYLGNVAPSVREKDIEESFKWYGRLRDVVVKNGFGFVEFDK